MIVDKVFVAKRVATKLRATEAAVDAALVEATELMGDMIRGRVETKVSAVATDATMAKVAAAIAALAEPFGRLAAALGLDGDPAVFYRPRSRAT